MNSRKISLSIFLALLLVTSCDLDRPPYDGIDQDIVFSSAKGIEAALLGAYGYFHYQDPGGTFGAYDFYLRLHHFMGEYAGDNVALSGTTTDPLFNIYTYNHNVDNGSVKAFYQSSYKMIIAINRLIENIELEGENDPRSHMLGECHFLRGFAYFNLVNAFGRPYQQDPETNLGISLKLDTDIENIPPRATVKEVYNAIEEDLSTAAKLMGLRDEMLEYKWHNIRASKEVAWAALSRFYLYKNEEELALNYADSIINTDTYSLITDSTDYVNYTVKFPEENSETIFAIKQTEDDNVGWAAIGAMYYAADGNGWGEMYASEPYRDLVAQNPVDWRNSFIHPQYKEDGTLDNRNGYPKYYVSKCSFQEDLVLYYSPVMFRLGEIYLNRAEAHAKLGHIPEGVADVNVIRERVNIPAWNEADFSSSEQLVDSILQERRIELAFEAHRKFDIFRNNKILDRRYPGTHEGVGPELIPPEHPRVVLYIPEDELRAQDNLEQNP
ncbi:MAG: RagB/SusD family nutrient uptake outer membrane protein [Bacteroidota bacterium]